MDFTLFPLGLPKTATNAKKVNDILQMNYNLQEQLCVSNACCIANLVLNRCLSEAGISSEVVYGALHQNTSRTPHVWLKIYDHVVDNTYFLGETVERKLRVNKYEDMSVRDVSGLFFGDRETARLGLKHNIDEFEWMLSNPERTLALSRNVFRFSQYLDQMATYMKLNYEIDINFDGTTSYCWGCSRTNVPLKTCGKCK